MKNQAAVRIWPETVTIPTYLVGEPNRNPMFLEKRVYQGSSGRAYPYPVIDKISDEKVEERHRAVHLENRYLKLMVMPDFGGRIQYAYDKTNEYAFIYHNQVIKPALVGLAGPWLSGGIEFNWPQHHRPGTYCPVDYTITSNADGSQTLWLSEIEPMWHLKGTLGLTLHPGKAYLEINVRLFNPTALPQSFHLWTNPAVHVDDHYQSIFPPDVQAVYDHGKRDVSAFPIARGTYYKVDYSKGVDISWYKNLPVPTSYMAAKSDYNFVGGYDHAKRAGVLHVADHHFVPGKKQWVWGCGDFGKAWDRNLTDESGPYAELMCGVFADNQPDFSWLQPFEEKEVKQFFLPFKAIGYVRNATIHAAVSLEIAGGKATLGAYATSPRKKALVRLSLGAKRIWEKTLDLSPEKPLVAEVPVPKNARPQDFQIEVLSAEREQLVAYTPEPVHAEGIPEIATVIPQPRKVASPEALYLAGLHLEQFRHATREPEDYYREALRREPGDIRNNTALGGLLLRRGQFGKAEIFFRAAIKTETRHNPNPPDGEAHYKLGVCLRLLGKIDEAREVFAKAAWNTAWQDAAFFQLAQIAALKNDFTGALELVDRSLARNTRNQKATHLKIYLLRKLNRVPEARERAAKSIERDPLDFGALNEAAALDSGRNENIQAERVSQLMRHDPHTHMEIAWDYARAGGFAEATRLLKCLPGGAKINRAAGHEGSFGLPNLQPMVYYFLGYFAQLRGKNDDAARYYKLTAAQNPERCFPNSLESILALEAALKFNPRDARAAFYLGNLWYDKRQFNEATACWEQSARADRTFATAQRNLAIAYFNKQHQPGKALRAMERAYALDAGDARVLFELDLLKKRAGVAPAARFKFLQKHFAVVEQREDLLIEYVTLQNLFGQHQPALDVLSRRNFHPWEGGEGKVTGQYVTSLIELAKQELSRTGEDAGHLAQHAIQRLERARHYPQNLGEGKLHGAQENQLLYWLGVAHEKNGDLHSAKILWRAAADGIKVPLPAIYYNDQNPETIFYQGLARQKLGAKAAATERFKTLVNFGKKHLHDEIVIDYFAVSLPEFMVFDDDLNRRNEINCRYLIALGLFGLGRHSAAMKELSLVLKLDPSHQAARLHLQMFQKWKAFAVEKSAGGSQSKNSSPLAL
jgi:tetratricopeptide (TPR) repeat protein